MPRRLGRTDLWVSPLGYGAFKIGRNQGIKYPHGYSLPDENQVRPLLNEILELGCNLIDTAPAYGCSEERIGRWLAHRRQEFVLCTKVGEQFENGVSYHDFSAAAVERSLSQSLQRLRTNVLDVVLLHSPGGECELRGFEEALDVLKRWQRRGIIRACGLSAKTVGGAQAALEWAQVLMLEYHCLDTQMEGVLHEAQRRQVGILIKKGFASGRLQPEQAIPFVLSHPAVTSLVVSTLQLEHFRQNWFIAQAVIEHLEHSSSQTPRVARRVHDVPRFAP